MLSLTSPSPRRRRTLSNLQILHLLSRLVLGRNLRRRPSRQVLLLERGRVLGQLLRVRQEGGLAWNVLAQHFGDFDTLI